MNVEHQRTPRGAGTSAPQIAVRFGSATHSGHHRADNEDALLARPPIFVIADGMGGHDQGREAAHRVIDAFKRANSGDWVTPQSLEEATTVATERVRALAEDGGGAPGSTVTGVGFFDHSGQPSWLVFNIGDSRTYLVHGDDLEQVTVDHSGRQELLDRGLTEAEAHQRVSANVITRAIGGGMRIAAQLDQWVLPARVGDRLVLCSDGLSGEIEDRTIHALSQLHADPQAAAEALVAEALDAGGRDNVTVVVVDAMSVSSTLTQDPLTSSPDHTVDETVELDLAPIADSGDTTPDMGIAP